MKRFFLIFILLFPLLSVAQDHSNGWKEFYSYYHIKDLDYGNGKVYTAAENAIFTTDIGSFDQKTISTLDGLEGEEISAILYLEDDNSLLIGYNNGLIQLYNFVDKKVKTFIDIEQKATIPPDKKRINEFYKSGDAIYIAANYGITKYNPVNKEFSDTYFIGDGGSQLTVNSITVQNNKIYAATENKGIRYADLDNSDIVDYNEWTQLGSGTYKSVVLVNNNLYALNDNNTLQVINNNTFNQVYQFSQTVKDLKSKGNYITATSRDKVVILNKQIHKVATFFPNGIDKEYTTGITLDNGELFIGNETYGLIESNINNPNNYDFLSPNGPLENNAFALDQVAGNLYVAFGERNYYYNPYPLRKRGISHFKDGQWINIPYSELPEFQSIISVSANPNNPNQVFFCSYHDGILELENDDITNFYNINNSGLEPFENPTSPSIEIRIGPTTFDKDGNLWIANAMSKSGLIKLPPNGGANSFVKYDISDIINDPETNNGFGEIITDDKGNVYMASYRDGVIGYNPSTHKFAKVKGGAGQGNLPNDYIRSLALDHNNQLWIGGRGGLRVLFNPETMFSNPNISAQNIVFLDSQGVAQELFSGLTVTSIAVDGNNNKWIGSTAGAYYVSSDGQETFHHFTTENSPLPSNNINDIKIDGETGYVYFGTDKGLVAFHGNSTSAENDLKHLRAYPNPVRPQYEGSVTIDGLMKDSNVKITDVEGNLVYEEVSKGGSIQWDTRAFGKYKVASGVYFVMVSVERGQKTKITKIMIIR